MPNSPYLLDTYGKVLFKKQEYPSAVDAYKKALLSNYQNSEILDHYGDALFKAGKIEEAITAWEDALKYGNDSPTLQQKVTDKTYYPTPNE